MSDRAGLTAEPLERDPADATVTAGRTERQHAIAALIHQAVIENGIDYAGGDSDVVAVHAATIGYHVIDALRGHGQTITRRR